MIKYLFILACFGTSLCFGQGGKEKTVSDVTNCALLSKAFIKKNGEPTDISELYLSCSIQDYFIKICEGEVTREELLEYLDEGISVKMEIREGEWDICDEDSDAQSRIGTYVVIHSIEE